MTDWCSMFSVFGMYFYQKTLPNFQEQCSHYNNVRAYGGVVFKPWICHQGVGKCQCGMDS